MAPSSEHAGGERLAAALDWEALREPITRLYAKNSLVDVMDLMQRNYNFYATPRMYKARLKKWGVSKNVKRSEYAPRDDRPPADLPDYGAAAAPPYVDVKWEDAGAAAAARTGASSSSQMVLPYYQRPSPTPSSVHHDARRKHHPNSTIVIPPGIIRSLGTPDQQRHVLNCLRSVNKFIAVSSSTGRWKVSSAFTQSLKRSEWLAQVTTSAMLLRNGQTRKGFRLLEDCFDLYKDLLTRATPLLTSETFMATFNLLNVSPELGVSFLRYARELAGIVLTTSHPLYQLFTQYLSLEIEIFWSCSDLFLGSLLDLMREHQPGWKQEHHDSLLLTTARMYLLSLTPLSEYEDLVKRTTPRVTAAGAAASSSSLAELEAAADQKLPLLGGDILAAPALPPIPPSSSSSSSSSSPAAASLSPSPDPDLDPAAMVIIKEEPDADPNDDEPMTSIATSNIPPAPAANPAAAPPVGTSRKHPHPPAALRPETMRLLPENPALMTVRHRQGKVPYLTFRPLGKNQ